MDYINQESERLTFRKLEESDIPKWVKFFENNPFLPYLGIDLSKDHKAIADEWIRAQFVRYEEFGLGHLALEIKETKEFVGMAGIISRSVEEKEEFEIAYSLLPKYWGKGFATEAVLHLKKFGFEQNISNTFISIIHVDHSASKKVAKNNAMEIDKETEYLGMPVQIFRITQG